MALTERWLYYTVPCSSIVFALSVMLIVYICVYRSTFAVDGSNMTVNKDVERVLKEFHSVKKPIG